MINVQRQRVEQEITTLVDDLDKSQLRKMQVGFTKNILTMKFVNFKNLKQFLYLFFFLERHAHLCFPLLRIVRVNGISSKVTLVFCYLREVIEGYQFRDF